VTRLLLALALACAAAGCRHVHRDTNAPGIIDVRTPPRDPAGTPRVRPADPGERMLTVNPGVFWGAGPQTAEPHGFGELGAEVTINLGENDRSHYEDDFFVYPQRGVGASLGWSAVHIDLAEDGSGEARLGPIYAEAQIFRLPWIVGGGLAVDPFDGDAGVQVFGAFTTLYARARYLVDGGAELAIGIQLKLPFVRVWSR